MTSLRLRVSQFNEILHQIELFRPKELFNQRSHRDWYHCRT